jgi:septum formation topological specificity factor MinE
MFLAMSRLQVFLAKASLLRQDVLNMLRRDVLNTFTEVSNS